MYSNYGSFFLPFIININHLSEVKHLGMYFLPPLSKETFPKFGSNIFISGFFSFSRTKMMGELQYFL
jgi:hypothetical protein